MPATFGLPWGDAQHLTLSFAPDGAPIAGHTSTLFQTLNTRQSTAAWQKEILRAFQTWAVQANVNIGVKSDAGLAFGVAGKNQHDARFGDIRVAAQRMAPEVLAITVPSGTSLAGTWAGDLFLNSDAFAAAKAPSLFGVTLHEAGHALGLDNSTDPKSPLYSELSGAVAPTPTDILNLQALYGRRVADGFEGSNGNNSIKRAADVPIPGNSWDGDRPVAFFADLTTASDVDVYEIKPRSNYRGAMTVRLRSAGISLLAPHLTITNEKGKVLGEAQAASGFGDTVTIRLPRVTPGEEYFLRVDSKAADAFAIGGYGLAVTFDGTSKVDPALVDAVMAGDYGLIGSREIDALFRGQTRYYYNDDLHTDDTATTALGLTATPGYAAGTHYEVIGSLSDATDVDVYRVVSARPAAGRAGVMTVTVRGLVANGATPTATILDALQRPVAARVLANGNGTFTIQAAGVAPGATYFVRLPGSADPLNPTGNYEVAVDFGTRAAEVATFASGSVGGAVAAATYDLYVAQSQVFQLLLSAGTAAPGTRVRMTVTDANGVMRSSLVARAGETVSGDALFLTPGAYVVRFMAEGVAGGSPPSLAYGLAGASITDPVGPALADPTLKPAYGTGTVPPVFAYPGGVKTTTPYLLAVRTAR